MLVRPRNDGGKGLRNSRLANTAGFLAWLYIFCVVSFLLIFVLVEQWYIRRLNYLIFVFYTFTYLLLSEKIKKYVLLGIILIIWILIISLSGGLPSYFINNFGLLVLGLIPFFLDIKFTYRHIYWLVLLTMLIGFVEIYFKSNFQVFQISILESFSPTESNMAFIAGVFVLYFFLRKDWKAFLLTLFAAILFFKRIVLLGVFLSLIMYMILPKLKIMKSYRLRLLLILLLFIAGMISVLNSDIVIDQISVQIGIPSYVLTMGRTIWWLAIKSELYSNDALKIFLGHGVGASADFMKETFGIEHPHSDYIRVLYDMGIVGSILLFSTLSVILARNKNGILIAFYLAAVMLTDNIIVYAGHLWTLAALVKTEK